MPDPIVIVGAGQAGVRAALALRDAGFDGPVTVLGAEQAPPYERPPLSKGLLTGERDEGSCTIVSAEALAEKRIAFRPGTTAVAIDRDRRVVRTSDGDGHTYARLLLATGRRPRRLDLPPDVAPLAHELRHLEDAVHLRQALGPGVRLAIVGGGFIGLEVAASAVAVGARASIIELAPRLMARGVPEGLAARLAERHAAAGVALHLGHRIAAMAAVGAGLRLTLDDGTEIAADRLLVAIGASPRTELAAAAGLTVDGGIVVDRCLRTSDPAIFAAGDCAAFPDPQTGDLIARESWHNAELQGPLAARNMLGADEPFAPVPWFWSDQHDLTLQIAGAPEAATQTIERVGEHGLLLFHLADDGRLVGASALGRAALAKDFKVAQRLVEAGPTITAETLADPATRLKALLC